MLNSNESLEKKIDCFKESIDLNKTETSQNFFNSKDESNNLIDSNDINIKIVKEDDKINGEITIKSKNLNEEKIENVLENISKEKFIQTKESCFLEKNQNDVKEFINDCSNDSINIDSNSITSSNYDSQNNSPTKSITIDFDEVNKKHFNQKITSFNSNKLFTNIQEEKNFNEADYLKSISDEKKSESYFNNEINLKNTKQNSSTLPLIRQPKLKINDKTLKKLQSDTDDLIFDDLIERKNIFPNEISDEQSDNAIIEKINSNKKFKLINCPICSKNKKYKDPRKRYGIYCCSSCYEFFRKFIRKPQQFFCVAIGHCQLNSDELDVDFEKCKACWLKICLQKFTVEDKIYKTITKNYSPRLYNSPDVKLVTLDTISVNNSKKNVDDLSDSVKEKSSFLSSSTNKMNDFKKDNLLVPVVNNVLSRSISAILKSSSKHKNGEINSYSALGHKGPRVKRVCRSFNDVYKGLPKAVFPSKSSTNSSILSIGNNSSKGSKIPTSKQFRNKKVKLQCSKLNSESRINFDNKDDSECSYDSDDLPITEYIARNIKKELNNTTNSSL